MPRKLPYVPENYHNLFSELAAADINLSEQLQRIEELSLKIRLEELCAPIFEATFYKGEYRSIPFTSGELMLFFSEELMISLVLYDKNFPLETDVLSFNSDQVIVPLSSSLPVDKYKLPAEKMKNEEFTPNIKLQKERVIIPRNQASYFSGFVDFFEPTRDKNIICLSIRTRPRHQLIWSFDRDNLESKTSRIASMRKSRIVTYIRLLRAMGCDGKRLEEVLTKLTADDFHIIRWEAIQSLAETAPELAINALKSAAMSDPHTEVRNAAKSTCLTNNII